MKVLAGLLWASAALEACAVSAQALLYISDQDPVPSKEDPPSISPITARLLLAERLGLSQYHSLEDADGSTLEILNALGGEQRRLFKDDDQPPRSEKFLFIIEGVTRPEDLMLFPRSPVASIHSQPTSTENLQLVLDLLEQDRRSKSTQSDHGSMEFHSSSSLRGGVSASPLSYYKNESFNEVVRSDKPRGYEYTHLYRDILSEGRDCRDCTTILHDSSLQGLTSKDGDRYLAAISDLRSLINLSQRSGSSAGTVILMPATTKHAKRSTTSSYGTYFKPLSARQEPEQPLSSPSTSSTQHSSVPETLQASTSPLPHGVLPVCHPSLESANAATNNCSGHGTVYKKSGKEGEYECFACKCTKTVLTADNGGVKTIYWGGPACQKKDISVPFFLLAGISIALLGAVTWGIGLMSSIGQEPLPSVIGAGVTGPRAQK